MKPVQVNMHCTHARLQAKHGDLLRQEWQKQDE